MKRKATSFLAGQKTLLMAAVAFVLFAVLFVAGRETLFAYGTKDPYYVTNKTIVIKEAYDADFDVKIFEDGGDRVWDYSYLKSQGLNGYVPKGTVVRRNPASSYSEYHAIELDSLKIQRNGNDQHVIFYCDTNGATPYLKLGRNARKGYTLTGVNVTGEGNAGTTTVSGGGRISTHEDTTVDTSLDSFSVYAAATSIVSELTCYWQQKQYDLYLNPLSRDGTQGYINGTDAYGYGPTCINTTSETLITVGANLVYGSSNWHNVSGYPASRPGYEFIGWEDNKGVLVYDANGECTRERKYFDENGNYCYDGHRIFWPDTNIPATP